MQDLREALLRSDCGFAGMPRNIRRYEVTSTGVVILGKRVTNHQGPITGIPVHSHLSDPKEEPSQERRLGAGAEEARRVMFAFSTNKSRT